MLLWFMFCGESILKLSVLWIKLYFTFLNVVPQTQGFLYARQALYLQANPQFSVYC